MFIKRKDELADLRLFLISCLPRRSEGERSEGTECVQILDYITGKRVQSKLNIICILVNLLLNFVFGVT